MDVAPQIRPMLHMTLSVDHRSVDGSAAAHFMSALKSMLESPIQALWQVSKFGRITKDMRVQRSGEFYLMSISK